MLHWYIAFSFIIALLYMFIVWWAVFEWQRLPLYQFDKSHQCHTKVSVIIAARNEADNIIPCLSAIIGQGYPTSLFEIIVVDDHSSDCTVENIRRLQNLHSGIVLIELNETSDIGSYKKLAIKKAIAASTGDLIVTTDADCIMGKDWLQSIVEFYETGNFKMIAGPVSFYNEKSLFEKIQGLEFSGLMATTAAFIRSGRPVLCNGANLAYEKEAFNTVNGFDGIDHIPTGDDVLLMNKINSTFPGSVGFLKSKEAVVCTKAQQSMRLFLQQRKRWASKGLKINGLYGKLTPVIVFGYNLVILSTLLLACFFKDNFLYLFIILFGLKCLIDFLFLFLSAAFFQKRRFTWYIVPVQLFYLIYVVYVAVTANIGTYEWKGRIITRKMIV